VLTVVEVAGLVAVIAVGFAAEPAPLAMPMPDPAPLAMSGIAGATLLAFFAFVGFEDMVNMVEETRDPARTMPRAILLALGITTVLYLLVALAAVRTVLPERLAESASPLALVYETATGRHPWFLAIVAGSAALNGVLALVVMTARVLYGLGRRGYGFGVFHHAHPRWRTPVLATAVATGAVVALALTAPLVTLAEITSLLLLAVFVAVNLSLVALKRRGEGPAGAFRIPAWVPGLGAAVSAVALVAGAFG